MKIREGKHDKGLKRKKKGNHGIRTFEVPSFCYDAQDFTSMTDWEKEQMTEAPFTARMSKKRSNGLSCTHRDGVDAWARFPAHERRILEARSLKRVALSVQDVSSESPRECTSSLIKTTPLIWN